MQKYEQLCISKNDKVVLFDPINSHTATHFKDSPKLKEIVAELLSQMVIKGKSIAGDFDMGKIVGFCDVVEIDDTDELIYAMRKQREDQGYVPFTKSRQPQPSSFVSIYLVHKNGSNYELLSTWIGNFDSPDFPQMHSATTDSLEYWSKHAFVWGSQEIIPDSEIDSCPW
jgi:hypothetical protein